MSKTTIKGMAVQVAACMPRCMEKMYYDPKNNLSRDWEPHRKTDLIAREYARIISAVTSLISTLPESTVYLEGEYLMYGWPNGNGKMKMDAVDIDVLIPHLEKALGYKIQNIGLAA